MAWLVCSFLWSGPLQTGLYNPITPPPPPSPPPPPLPKCAPFYQKVIPAVKRVLSSGQRAFSSKNVFTRGCQACRTWRNSYWWTLRKLAALEKRPCIPLHVRWSWVQVISQIKGAANSGVSWQGIKNNLLVDDAMTLSFGNSEGISNTWGWCCNKIPMFPSIYVNKTSKAFSWTYINGQNRNRFEILQ